MTGVGVSENEAKKPTLATLKRAIALWEGKAKESGNVAQAGKTKVDALQKIYDQLCQKDANVALDTVTSEQQQAIREAGVANGEAGKWTLATVKDTIASLSEQKKDPNLAKKSNVLQGIYDRFRQKADAGVMLETATPGQQKAMAEAGLPGDELGSLTLENLKEKITCWQGEVKKGENAAKEAKQNAKFLQKTYDKCRTAAQQKIAGPVIVRASAAMAGVIARVDRERGVWRAPANVALAGVTELVSVPTSGDPQPIRLDDALNETLVNHKINAIRSFRGQGLMVWGARTMAGPSEMAWCYISVRRLFNTVERDACATLRTMVFEPNNAPTWEAVRSALDHYLFALWRKGALQGETPTQAYFVQIGLRVTMTPDDIDNGRMIIKMGLAAVRPAEFIVLQLTQDMVPN
ncbi:phage tail sheath family protein [Mycetohabitans sp. B46]